MNVDERQDQLIPLPPSDMPVGIIFFDICDKLLDLYLALKVT